METRGAFSGSLNFDTSTWFISVVAVVKKTVLTTSYPPPLCLYDIHKVVIKIIYLAGLWSSHKVQILQGSPQSCHRTEDKTGYNVNEEYYKFSSVTFRLSTQECPRLLRNEMFHTNKYLWAIPCRLVDRNKVEWTIRIFTVC